MYYSVGWIKIANTAVLRITQNKRILEDLPKTVLHYFKYEYIVSILSRLSATKLYSIQSIGISREHAVLRDIIKWTLCLHHFGSFIE